ncbi:MAG: HEAT repeat domain-containing protein [Candidatus Omnitrophica bacterium]|nr:HEAT repeat domain-containing protein [Candidatus Omnitrophota bacterium]
MTFHKQFTMGTKIIAMALVNTQILCRCLSPSPSANTLAPRSNSTGIRIQVVQETYHEEIIRKQRKETIVILLIPLSILTGCTEIITGHPIKAIITTIGGFGVATAILFVSWRVFFPVSWYAWRLKSLDENVRQKAVDALSNLRDSRTIRILIKTLKDRSSSVRDKGYKSLIQLGWTPSNEEEKINFFIAKKAWAELAQMGEIIVGPLIKMLEDPDSKVREGAVTTLGEIGSRQAIEPLISTLRDPDSSVRMNAVTVLGKFGDLRAVESLITLWDNRYDFNVSSIRDTNQQERFRIERQNVVKAVSQTAVSQMNNPRVVEFLIKMLSSGLDDEVESSVIKALGVLKNPRAATPIKRKLSETKSMPVALSAIDALINIGEPIDTEPVMSLIQRLVSKDSWVRKMGAEALGRIGDLRAVEPLIELLLKEKDRNIGVRHSAEMALSKMRSSRATEALIEVLESRKEGRDRYIESNLVVALGNTGDPRIVEPLINILKDPFASGPGCKEAAKILGDMGDLRAIEPLTDALNDRYDDVREQAAESLVRFNWRPNNEREKAIFLIAVKDWNRVVTMGESAVGPLINTLGDNVVIEEVTETLGRIGAPEALMSLQRALSRESPTVILGVDNDAYEVPSNRYIAIQHAIVTIKSNMGKRANVAMVLAL